MREPDNAWVLVTAIQPGPRIGLTSYARTVARVAARTGKEGLGREDSRLVPTLTEFKR